LTALFPSLDDLVARMRILKLRPLKDIFYRSTTTKYADDTDLITGEGSRLHGGRWNPPGIAAVYALRRKLR